MIMLCLSVAPQFCDSFILPCIPAKMCPSHPRLDCTIIVLICLKTFAYEGIWVGAQSQSQVVLVSFLFSPYGVLFLFLFQFPIFGFIFSRKC